MRHSWRIFFLFVVGGFCSANRSNAQAAAVKHYWVYLNERTSAPTTPQQLGITERALKRRAKVLPPDRLIDDLDYPVSQSAITQILSTGARIRTESRWLNAVSVEATAEQLTTISVLPFVTALQRVVSSVKRPADDQSASGALWKNDGLAGVDYGPSATQVNAVHAATLHQIGVNGTDVVVGLLDDGFNNHAIHPALKNIRLLGERDFIYNDNNTSREAWEYFSQGNHGASTLSLLGGFDKGKLIGVAFGSSFMIGKTEIDSTEVPYEEDLYVAGLEWLERGGADIVSTSLGYVDWYRYPDLNGRFATTSKAAQILARKGVLLVTAMGNEGWFRKDITGKPMTDSTGTLIAPADADSILSVGATNFSGILASFSSTGPAYDGRIKPEIAAPGVGLVAADGSSTNYTGIPGPSGFNGTSAATPMTAGVAALILSAHLELTPMQIRQAMISTAVPINDGTSKSARYPNNYYGYGLVDALEAALSQGLVFSNRPIALTKDSSIVITTWIRSKTAPIGDSVALYYKQKSGGSFTRVPLTLSADVVGHPYEYSARISKSLIGSSPVGYFTARDNQGTRRSPYNAPDSLFSLDPTPDSILNVFPTPDGGNVPRDFVLYNNYPNPFNPGTTIRFYAPRAEQTELTIFNLLGQRIQTLFSGIASLGVNTYQWTDSRDDNGRPVSSGVYLYRLKTTGSVLTNKMLYLK